MIKIIKCYYNGEIHLLGETFIAVDKCNTCSCKAKGKVDCTENKCPPSTTPGNNKLYLIIVTNIYLKSYVYHCLKYFTV